ncbi:hypothetical protein CFP56_010768 [Quercus suber]|uniref:Uncharacterized protein n=1 Tax=Quercus suber TaxID=58331 RepID=A0AAW0L176_QUESU
MHRKFVIFLHPNSSSAPFKLLSLALSVKARLHLKSRYKDRLKRVLSKRCHLKKGGDSEKSSVPFVVQKVSEVPSSSPTFSIEELTTSLWSFKAQDKGKFVSDLWNDPGLAMAKAHYILAESMYMTANYLDMEEKLASAQAKLKLALI